MTDLATPTYTASTEQIRLVHGALSFAQRCEPQFAKVRTSQLNPAAARGIQYENKVHRALAVLAKSIGATVERNPWFRFADSVRIGTCSPDALIWFDPLAALIIEVKYTWVPGAAVKLKGLYVPVVNEALKPAIIRTLVICKNLTPDAPQPIEEICEGTQFSINSSPVYQWRGQGPLVW